MHASGTIVLNRKDIYCQSFSSQFSTVFDSFDAYEKGKPVCWYWLASLFGSWTLQRRVFQHYYKTCSVKGKNLDRAITSFEVWSRGVVDKVCASEECDGVAYYVWFR